MSRLRLPNGDDHPDAAQKHLLDAGLLLVQQRPDGAAYLSGYVVECALKSLLVLETKSAPQHHNFQSLVQQVSKVATFAGPMNEAYPDKLARVDMEEAPPARESGLARLLHRVRDELQPQWILLDARTSISESAGRLLSGIAHLHVLLGTTQDQSWQGLNIVLDRLGKERVLAGRSQAEAILVQAMVPSGEAGKVAREVFLARAEQEFTDRYYAEAGAGDEDAAMCWNTRDMDSLDAPHVAVPVEYDAKLATFGDIAEVAEPLCAGPYAMVAERITGRFAREADA